MKPSKVNTIILTVYLLLVCFPSVYLYVTHNKLALLGIVVAMSLALWALARVILKLVGRIEIRHARKVRDRDLKLAFVIASVLSFAIIMIWFIAYFPGSYQPDVIHQLDQAVTGKYDNWHPIWHTLLFFTIPTKVFGAVWSIVIWQAVWFSLTMGYLFIVLYKYAGIKWAVGSYAYIMLNPFTGYILMFVVKDIAFAIACLMAVAMFAKIYFEGADTAGYVRCALIGFALANATLFRYNGVIFTGLMLVALIFYVSKIKWLVSAAVFGLTIWLVNGPVTNSLDAEVNPTEVMQTVGFPMSIIGNAVVETPDLLDEEITGFAYGFSPKEVWEERYRRGNFNLMKYGGAFNPGIIEETGAGPIVRMAFKCIAASPQASFDAIFALTDFVYGLDVQDKADIDIVRNVIDENDYDLKPAGFELLAHILERYHSLIRLKGFNFFRKLGFALLTLVSAVLAGLGWSSLREWKKIIPCIPLIGYAFGTMLLLSGHDARFFYLTFLISPLVFVMARYRS